MPKSARIRPGMLAVVLVASCGGLAASCGGRTLTTDAGRPLGGAGGAGAGVAGAGVAGAGVAGQSGAGGRAGSGPAGMGGVGRGGTIGGVGGVGGFGGTVGRGGASGIAGIGGSVAGRGGTGGPGGTGGTGGTVGGRGGVGGVSGSFGGGGSGAVGGLGGRGGIGGTSGTGGVGGTSGTGGVAGRGGFGGTAGTGAVAGTGGIGGTSGTGGIGGTSGTGGTGGIGGMGGTAGVGCPTCSVTSLPIPGREAVYDATRNRLYVSVAGDALAYPNTIVVVDPTTASVVSTIPIGSNPGALALSSDASTLWVGIEGAHAFRKVTLTSTPPVVGPLNRLPKSSDNRYFDAVAMAALPGAPQSVVILMSIAAAPYGYSYSADIRVFDDGVPRPTAVRDASPASLLAAGPPGYVFAASNNYGGPLYSLSVSASGISQTSTSFFSFFRGYLTDIVYSGTRLYGSSGDVVDVASPASPFWSGRYPFTGPIAAHDAQTVLMLTSETSNTFPFAPKGTLRLLSTSAFREVTNVPLPTSVGPGYNAYSNLVYAGADAVAFLRADETQLLKRLVIVHDPAFGTSIGGPGGAGGSGGIGGTSGVGGAGGIAVDPCPGCSLVAAPAYGRHLAHDASRNLIYVTADATAVVHPSSLVTVDPAAATVTSIVPVGNDPQPLALSDDKSVLWVGLAGDRRVRRMTPGTTPVPGTAYPLPMLLTTAEPAVPSSLVVLPGMPSSIAVSVYGLQQGGRGAFILDDGLPRANFVQPPEVGASFLINGPPGYLLGVGDLDNLVVFRLGAAGATYESYGGLLTTYNQINLAYSGGSVYASTGEVIDFANPEDPLPVGRFAFAGCAMAVRSASRVLMLCPSGYLGPTLRVVDTATFTSVGSVTLPDALIGAVWSDFAYLGGDAVAMLAYGLPLQILHAPLIGNQP